MHVSPGSIAQKTISTKPKLKFLTVNNSLSSSKWICTSILLPFFFFSFSFSLSLHDCSRVLYDRSWSPFSSHPFAHLFVSPFVRSSVNNTTLSITRIFERIKRNSIVSRRVWQRKGSKKWYRKYFPKYNGSISLMSSVLRFRLIFNKLPTIVS